MIQSLIDNRRSTLKYPTGEIKDLRWPPGDLMGQDANNLVKERLRDHRWIGMRGLR